MADPAPNTDPNNGGGDGGSTPPATPPAGNSDIDLSKIPADQLVKVLENPELWNQPRIKALRDDSAAYKKLQEETATANEQKLKDEKKFEELANTKESENSTLREQIKTSRIDQALTNKLVPDGVVDLEAALKLVDRSKVSIDDNGNVTGVDEALAALKTDKTYLFDKQGQPRVGSPTNGNTPPSGPAKFKRSQLQDQAFYNENRKEIIEAAKAGLIEDDVR